jgi:MFS family permease
MPAPLSRPVLALLIALGTLYMIMMGSTFSSLGVVLPHMIATLGMNWGQAGFGFTLLALAAGGSSVLPALLIRRIGGRRTVLLGVLDLMAAYADLAGCDSVAFFDAGALLLGTGFSLIGAVPALHILGGWAPQRRGLVFGVYLAFGGMGGALWPFVVQTVIGQMGDWRGYWWFMVGLIALSGALCLAVIKDPPPAVGDADAAAAAEGWTLAQALRTRQFYVVGCGIAATYLVASTVNAFTISYLTLIGVGGSVAVTTFAVQSFCHAGFPLLLGGVAERVGAKPLLAAGLIIQVLGMLALAIGQPTALLILFAIGVGGGYGTVFLATTLTLQQYFGAGHAAEIFGANQLFTTISVVGPALVGGIADLTGRFDLSFVACALLLALAALAAALLRPPPRLALIGAPAATACEVPDVPA